MSKPSQLNDPPEIVEAIAALNRHQIRFSRPNRWQLKIGDLSFYPTKGTICRDGEEERLPERGLDALLQLLAQRRKPQHRAIDQTRSSTPTWDFSLATEVTIPPAESGA
jgi:DNA-binding response OmpR family regulator